MDNQWFGSAICWAARLVGMFLLVMILAVAIGEGLPNPMQQPLAVRIEMVALLGMWLGLIVAWKSELIGGMVVVLGYACFCLTEWPALRLAFPFGLFPFAGLLYIVSWFTRK